MTRVEPAHARPSSIVLLSIWLGLATGLGEVALLAIARHGLGRLTHKNPQDVWMAPVAYAVLFAACSAVLVWALRRRPTTALRASSMVTLFLACLGGLFLVQSLHAGAAALIALGVAVQGSALVVRWPSVSTIGRATVGPLALLVLALGVGYNGWRAATERRAVSGVVARPAPPATAPNVLLIVWDTVRASNLSAYKYARPTTPNLERLAQRSVVFDRATSPAPWTLTSHASMFTGLVPRQMSADWWRPLEKEPPTIAELLSRHGYLTGAFVANVLWAGRNVGLDRGFARFEDYPIFSAGYFLSSTSLTSIALTRDATRRISGMHEILGRKSADEVNAEFLDWLSPKPDRPFFAFLNYFDAHSPYLPPAPFDTAFGPEVNGRWPFMAEGVALQSSELQLEIDAYDGAIAYLDDRLGRLLEALDRRALLRNTLVIVTSDHGEEFGEHGVYRHGNSLFDESLHVPLLISLPGRVPEGRRVTSWVTTRDVGATIQRIAGLDGAAPLPGSSLERFWRDPQDAMPETIVASVSEATGHPGWYPVAKGDMVASMEEPLKYILTGDGTEAVYDLRADPGESRNLASTTPGDVMTRLRAAARAR